MPAERISLDDADRRMHALMKGVIGPGLPRRRRDQWILLHAAAAVLAPGVTLDEKSLNEKLKTWLGTLGPHASLDHVSVRRALVDERFAERSPDGATYRRSRAHEPWVIFEEDAR
jgi:hypothetical protein